jgi:RNA polymerase sigma-70 factor (ECF subfamily)
MGPKNNLEGLSDDELVEAINEGDEAAFETLYYRHRDWVLNLAFRWTGNRELALDVLQETFFSLAKRCPGFKLTARLQTFLYPVIRNLSITARRKSDRYALDPEGLEQVEAPQTEARVPDGRNLQAVIQGLSEAHRDVLLLRFVDDLSLEQIADVLGIPVGTVKSRLHNALTTLRKDERTRKYFEQ